MELLNFKQKHVGDGNDSSQATRAQSTAKVTWHDKLVLTTHGQLSQFKEENDIN